MTSLLVHAALGALTIGVFFYVNAHLYRSDWAGSRVTFLEGLYYALAVGSVCVGWYFNVQYVLAYPAEAELDPLHQAAVHQPRGGIGRPGPDRHEHRPVSRSGR